MYKELLFSILAVISCMLITACESSKPQESVVNPAADSPSTTLVRKIADMPQKDVWTQIPVYLQKPTLAKDAKLPYISRISPDTIYNYMLLEALGDKFMLTSSPTKCGISVEIAILSIGIEQSRINIQIEAKITDRAGEHIRDISASAPVPQGYQTNEFSLSWHRAYEQAIHASIIKLISEIYKMDASPLTLPKDMETRGYVAEMYINKNIRRVIIDTAAAKVYSVEDINSLPVEYILYGIARGNGFKAATADINKLKDSPELLDFLTAQQIGIVLLNADRTEPDFEIENSRLADKMGAKGALTYVLADKSGIRLWHTFGRLNIQILRSALPANTVSQWVEKLYEMINVEKVDSLEWFTPFIDTNAY